MNNKLPQIKLVYDRYKTATATKPAVVEIRITYNYKQKYISTGVMLLPHQWKKGIITDIPDVVQISQTLENMLTEVKQVLYEMLNEGSVDIFSIPERLERKKQKKLTFLEFCNQRAIIRKYGKRKDSQERYNRFIRLFTAWGKIKEFEDINDKNIIAYDKYLESTGMKAYSKWNNYHRFLNSFILDAIDEGLLKRNPYKWINIEKNKNSKGIERCLTPDEFRKLKAAELPTESLKRIRDLFIFQTYTCMAYADLKDFDAGAVQEIKGMKVYLGSRVKTDKPFTIPILSPAWDILMKYEGKLPIISNVKYNLYLKTIAQAAGLDKAVSSHWARHTGATLLLNEGIPMQIVSKICGHSSTRITEQVYAKLLDETVVDAVQDLEI